MRGKLAVKYLAIKESDTRELVRRVINQKSGGNKVLSRPLSFANLAVKKVDWQENYANIELPLQSSLRDDFDFNGLKQSLIARTAAGAEEYLESVKGIKDADIKLKPFWVKRVPGFMRNIKLELALP